MAASSSSLSSWFPSGRHFNPTDDELLVHLFNYVTGEPFSCEDSIPIPIVDLYGDEEPWELFSKYYSSSPSSQIKKKKDVYFYTRLKKKNETTNGKRLSRLIGKGCWHGQDRGKQIFYKGKALLGFKKSLVYQNNDNPIQDRQWLLKEYSLSESVLEKDDLILPERRDYVLCRMRRKINKKESATSDEQGNKGDLSELFTKFQEKILANSQEIQPNEFDGDDLDNIIVKILSDYTS